MPYLNVKNRAESLLASGISDSDLSLTVTTGEGAKFPASNFHITIEDEILLCTSRTGDVLTVEREKEGTTAAAHATGKTVELRITAKIITELQEAIAAVAPHVAHGTFARTVGQGTGTQEVTGLGFSPKMMFFLCKDTDDVEVVGFGFDVGGAAGAGAGSIHQQHDSANDPLRKIEDRSMSIRGPGGSNELAQAYIESMDADGFTINWAYIKGIDISVEYWAIG